MRTKKMIAILLSLVVVAVSIGFLNTETAWGFVYAEGDVWIDTDGNTMTAEEASQWTYSGTSSITLSAYTGEIVDGKIVGKMPATINGKPIKTISSLFKDNTELVIAPEIPDTVTTMMNTFSGCTALETAELPASATNTRSAFYNCTALDEVYIPDTAQITNNTFDGTSVTVVYNQWCLAGYAYEPTSDSITKRLIIEEDTSILTDWIGADGKQMSYNDARMWKASTLTNSASIKGKLGIIYVGPIVNGAIVGQVPMYATHLANNNVYGNKYTADEYVGGTLYEVIAFNSQSNHNSGDYEEYSGIFGGTNNSSKAAELKVAPEIPNTFTDLGYAFYNCSSLTETPELHEGILSLRFAFAECTSLTEIPEIPESVTNMYKAFYNTPIKGSITIPDGVTTLEDTFTGTSETIYMLYSSANTTAADATVPTNVIKVCTDEISEDSYPSGETDEDSRATVTVKSETGSYEVMVGNTLQFEATINTDEENYKAQWVVQDLFDTNGEYEYYATINSDGLLTGVERGYVIVGLMIEFEDGTQSTYGLCVVSVVDENGISGYLPDGYTTDFNIPVGGGTGYSGGFNTAYGYTGSGFSSSLGGVTTGGSSTGGGTGDGGSDSTGGEDDDTNNDDTTGGEDSGDSGNSSGGNTGSGTGEVVDGTSTGNMPIYGLVEPINIIDITLPVNMTFTIHSDRTFSAPEAEILSNCPSPLNITVIGVNKSDNAPEIVDPDTYTDSEWNNLTRAQSLAKIGLMLNGESLAVTGEQIGSLKSAFEGEESEDLSLSAKYGKAWDNTEDISFSYNIVFEFEMP